MENELEERDAMDWLEDEMMRQWEEVSTEEKKHGVEKERVQTTKRQTSVACAGANGVTGADEKERKLRRRRTRRRW